MSAAKRIAILAAHEVPGITELLADPNRGATYELSVVVGCGKTFADAALLEQAGVGLALHPFRKSYLNLRAREDYDRELTEIVGAVHADYVLLAGYPYILTEAFLGPFENKVLAVHDGAPKYPGVHAVRDAILAGETETHSAVSLVTMDVGHGPLFLLGSSFGVSPMAADFLARGDYDALTQYADLHRRWMRRNSWGALMKRTIELLAGGTMQIVGDVVWIDGAPGPCRLGEAPRVCHEPARGIPASCPFIAP